MYKKMPALLETTMPILGYVIAIAVVLLIATLTFMSAVSTAIIQSATTMAQVLVLVALLVGIAAAATAAKNVS
jgi:amino acid transporter